jgi:integrase
MIPNARYQFRLLMAEMLADVRRMIATAVTTGMRVSEIIALKWKCVDLDRKIIRVIRHSGFILKVAFVTCTGARSYDNCA